MVHKMNKRKPTNKEVRAQLIPQWELLADLYATLERKCRSLGLHNPLGDRGTLCLQLIGQANGSYLFIMEGGYRGTLFPRVVYKIPARISFNRQSALLWALKAERKEKQVVALRDTRACASIADFNHDLDTGTLLDENGNGDSCSQEVSIKRAERAVQRAESDLKAAKAWLERAQSKAP